LRFHATIRLDGKTATGIEVPAEVLAALGPGKRPRVRVTINGYDYPSTVGSMGGRSLIPVSAEVRAKAGVAAGEQVDVDVVADTEPRRVEIPEDLAAALDGEPVARQAFERLSYSYQHRHVLAVTQAKTAETRHRRIGKVVAELSRAPATLANCAALLRLPALAVATGGARRRSARGAASRQGPARRPWPSRSR
jgi:hypothetical protein